MPTSHTQSLAGYIREHLTELEARLEVGVRQEVLVAELKKQGYKTTLKVFRNSLYRARLWAAKRSVHSYQQKEQVNEKIIALKPPKKNSPMMESKGFEFKGTANIPESDLI